MFVSLLISKFSNSFSLECGTGYTKKSEEIFRDVEISKPLNNEWMLYQKEKGIHLDIDVYVTVLQSNSWPLNNDPINKMMEPVHFLT